MILRFIAENITSFKEPVEFNTFPSSKSHNHENHKIGCDHAVGLRLSAIYGANGAGKSNLLNALNLMRTLLMAESLEKLDFYDPLYFRLDSQCASSPSGLAIEFYEENQIFYYHLEFNTSEILLEELLESRKSKDIEIFRREGSRIHLNADYLTKAVSRLFQDALPRLIRPSMLLLSFLGKYYPGEMPVAAKAYGWFERKLQIVLPHSNPKFLPHLMDTQPAFQAHVDSLIPDFNTGIKKLEVRKALVDEEKVKNNEIMKLVKAAKLNPGMPQSGIVGETGDIINIVAEESGIYMKSLVAVHETNEGKNVELSLHDESDGTRRLIEYLPLIFEVTRNDAVYVIDEIERSLHPIMIKEIVRKLSESKEAKGQLIFTTHESCLLDQDIFRPDEIWFAQKNSEQATQLYPLSDFNIHKTANIENGYLNGRYGAIPFLSNLKDLHW